MKKILLPLLLLFACEEYSPKPPVIPDLSKPQDMVINVDPCEKELLAFDSERQLLFSDYVSCFETNPKLKVKSTGEFSCGQSIYKIEESVPESMRITYNRTEGRIVRVEGTNKTITKCVTDKYLQPIACPMSYTEFYCSP